MSDFSKLPPVEYEKRDVTARGILRTAVVVIVLVVASALVSWGFFALLQHQDAAQRTPVPAIAQHQPMRQPPAPRLQEAPFDDIRELRGVEDVHQEQYRWVEKGRVVRIPIERAMRLYALRAASGQAADPFTVAPMAAVSASPLPAVASPGSHP